MRVTAGLDSGPIALAEEVGGRASDDYGSLSGGSPSSAGSWSSVPSMRLKLGEI